MFLTAKKAAFTGMTLTVSFLLLLLGSILEVSTLFFLAAAAFCIGIVIRELGLRMGAAFLAASILLGLLIAPNKLYVCTYGMIEGYLLLREAWWVFLEKRQKPRKSYLLGKAVIAQLFLLPLIFFAPRFFYAGEMTWQLRCGLLAAGEVFWFVVDMAYDVFQRQIWGKLRRHLDWMT